MAPCLAGGFGTIALLKQCSGLALDKEIEVAPQQYLALCKQSPFCVLRLWAILWG